MKTIVEYDYDNELFIYVVFDGHLPKLKTPRVTREQLAMDCRIRKPCHVILDGEPLTTEETDGPNKSLSKGRGNRRSGTSRSKQGKGARSEGSL